jgi:hypothetical protein
MTKRTSAVAPKAPHSERQQHLEEALRLLEQRSTMDLSFLDQIEDGTFKDEVLQLPYEEPRVRD